MLGEPIGCGLPRLFRARPIANRIVAALDFQETLWLAGAHEGFPIGVRRHDRIVARKDHQQGTRRDQIDTAPRSMRKDLLERAHRHLIAPSWRYRRLRAHAELVALLIRLHRKSLARLSGAGNVAFAAFGGVTDAFLDRQLLETGKLFR